MASNALLTYQDLHELTAIPMSTLYGLVQRRQVPHVRLGPRTVRFRRSEIDAWLAARSVPTEDRAVEPEES